jgi:hypothetical protein
MIILTPLIEIPGFMYGHRKTTTMKIKTSSAIKERSSNTNSHDHNHTKNTEPPTNPSNPHCHLQG